MFSLKDRILNDHCFYTEPQKYWYSSVKCNIYAN